MKRDFYSDGYKDYEYERNYMRNLPYDCANCGYMGRPSSSGIVCSTCILKRGNIKKSNNNSGA